MGILDGIVEWLSEQVIGALDLINTSVLGALGCNMDTFLRYFPAAETMYSIFVATAIGLILLNLIWQLFKNFGLITDSEPEDPARLCMRSILFIGLTYYSDEITKLLLSVGGTPYNWIMTSDLPALSFSSFSSVLITILGVSTSGSIALIVLIIILILAFNYLKLLLEAAERYVLLGVLVYTAPMAFATGSSKATNNIFSSWCRMFAGQIFLLIMNAWCLRLFTGMVGTFISNPLSLGSDATPGNAFIWFLCAIAFLKVSQKIDSFLNVLGINVGHTGGSVMAEAAIALKSLGGSKSLSGSVSAGTGVAKNAQTAASFLSGGLAGAVGRSFAQGAVHSVTGQSSNPISKRMFESSLEKGGEFANNVTGAVAKGSLNYTGSMTGPQAAQALSSYMGQTNKEDMPSYSQVEIGGGRIMGRETSIDHPNGVDFGMYNADQYMPPDGDYETVTTSDNSRWYRQYARDVVDRTPYMTAEGKIKYRESIVQRLPDVPRRKDRI